MAYQPDDPHPFWEHSNEYAATSEDVEFMEEVAYVMVTLYKSEVTQ